MKDASKHPLLDMFPELLNGVKYVNVGDVCDIHKGVQFNKSDMKEMGSYPVMNGGINPSGYAEVFNEDENTITISQGGASAGYVNFLDSKFWLGAHCYALKPYSVVMNRYLYHYIKQNEITLQQCQYGAGIPALAKSTISSLEIPLPPLPVQEAIVNILDRFTVYAAELQAELQARQQQYNYYRDTLLSFDLSADKAGGRGDVEWKKLGEVLKIKNGRDYKHLKSGNVPVYGSGGIMTYVDTQVYDKPSVLIPRKGSIDKLYYVDYPFWNVDTIFYTEINASIVIEKYVFYILQKEHLEKLNTGGGVPSLTQKVLNEVVIPIPSLSEQQRIVDILDRFDTLVNDLSQGLPAEIEARRQQYEYYRDKLLTFKRKEE